MSIAMISFKVLLFSLLMIAISIGITRLILSEHDKMLIALDRKLSPEGEKVVHYTGISVLFFCMISLISIFVLLFTF